MIRSLNFPSSDPFRGRARTIQTRLVTGVCLLIASWGFCGLAKAAPLRPRATPPPVVRSEQPSSAAERHPQNAADLRAIETRLESIADHVRQCTVGIIVGDSQGSGVIVSETGLVLTAGHVVVSPGRKLTVVLSDGKHVDARSLGVNAGTDCGAVQIAEGGPFPGCKISDMRTLRAGDWCVATGHPGGYQEGRAPVVRLGRVVEVAGGMLHSDCPLLGGDSGGPLFDLNGNVIAIHSRIGARTTLNLHVPIVLFLRDWDRLTTVAAPHVGDTESPSMLGVDGRDDPKGARITMVFPRSPADRAGLETGDIITSFAGQNVSGFEGLQKLISARRPGDVVEIRILRDQAAQQLRATIAARVRE
jgi:serine protease Do